MAGKTGVAREVQSVLIGIEGLLDQPRLRGAHGHCAVRAGVGAAHEVSCRQATLFASPQRHRASEGKVVEVYHFGRIIAAWLAHRPRALRGCM